MPALQHKGGGKIRLLPKLRHLRKAHVPSLRPSGRSSLDELRLLRNEVAEPDSTDCVGLFRGGALLRTIRIAERLWSETWKYG